MKIHELKILEKYFVWVRNGSKKFEIRSCKDRDFKEGDILHLKEWDDKKLKFTNRSCLCRVGYILKGGSYGLEEGFCILSITLINVND